MLKSKKYLASKKFTGSYKKKCVTGLHLIILQSGHLNFSVTFLIGTTQPTFQSNEVFCMSKICVEWKAWPFTLDLQKVTWYPSSEETNYHSKAFKQIGEACTLKFFITTSFGIKISL